MIKKFAICLNCLVSSASFLSIDCLNNYLSFIKLAEQFYYLDKDTKANTQTRIDSYSAASFALTSLDTDLD